LPETYKDTEPEPLDLLTIELTNNNNSTSDAQHKTWHPPQPALPQVLTKGIPTEAVILLNVVAVIWGSQHPVIKMVVDDCDPAAFSLVRFGLAAFIASLACAPPRSNTTTLHDEEDSSKTQVTWRWGAEMGLWMFLGYAFQAIGLEVSA
jgi:hypothetical protein